VEIIERCCEHCGGKESRQPGQGKTVQYAAFIVHIGAKQNAQQSGAMWAHNSGGYIDIDFLAGILTPH
jgi:hypothetical protein